MPPPAKHTRTPSDTPHILLVNPWIHDFAAYDFWAKPYGLLSLGGLLRLHGLRVSYIDCLDRFHPLAAAGDPHARHGRGPYLKTPLPKPAGLEDVAQSILAPDENARIEKIEQAIAVMQNQIEELKATLETFKKQFD